MTPRMKPMMTMPAPFMNHCCFSMVSIFSDFSLSSALSSVSSLSFSSPSFRDFSRLEDLSVRAETL